MIERCPRENEKETRQGPLAQPINPRPTKSEL